MQMPEGAAVVDPEAWARAVKSVLGTYGGILPVPLGWVLLGAGVLFALYKFAQLFAGRKP